MIRKLYYELLKMGILLINHKTKGKTTKSYMDVVLRYLSTLESQLCCVCMCGVCFKAFCVPGRNKGFDFKSQKDLLRASMFNGITERQIHIYIITDCPKAAHTVDLS